MTAVVCGAVAVVSVVAAAVVSDNDDEFDADDDDDDDDGDEANIDCGQKADASARIAFVSCAVCAVVNDCGGGGSSGAVCNTNDCGCTARVLPRPSPLSTTTAALLARSPLLEAHC